MKEYASRWIGVEFLWAGNSERKPARTRDTLEILVFFAVVVVSLSSSVPCLASFGSFFVPQEAYKVGEEQLKANKSFLSHRTLARGEGSAVYPSLY